MDNLRTLVARFVQDEQGQDLIEYALLATFVSLVAIAGATLLGTALNNWYDAGRGHGQHGGRFGGQLVESSERELMPVGSDFPQVRPTA